jgi:hypothetical protein
MNRSSIILILLFMSITYSLSAQNLVKENKMWSNTWIGTEHGGLFESCYIRFEGEALINGTAYTNIMKSDDSLHLSWYHSGYIREDSTGKVYLYNSVTPEHEELLYNFSLQEGDSVQSGWGEYYHVIDVQYVTFGSVNDSIKQYKLSYSPTGEHADQIWLEGIGNMGGVLSGLNEIGMVGAYKYLVCYYENDTLKYANPDFNTCFPHWLDSYIPNIKYREFAVPGARWYYSQRENPLGGPEEGYLEIKWTGDTVIQQKNSRILKKTYHASDSSLQDLGYEYVYNENRKVYYLDDSKFWLLYDFNAEKGDTLTFREPYFTGTSPDTTFSIVVDETKIITYNRFVDMKIIYSHTLTGPWDLFNLQIEKIGNLPYMFPQISLTCDAACFDPFRGYLDAQMNYWGSGWGPFNFLALVNGFADDSFEPQITVFPNPFDRYIIIGGLLHQEMLIELYDIAGRITYSVNHPAAETFRINTDAIIPGIYFISIKTKTGHGVFHQLLIK